MTIKIRGETYDILACMMTGAGAFNDLIEKLLFTYLKHHSLIKGDHVFNTIQAVINMHKFKIDLGRWYNEHAYLDD